jgi:nicotinate-nucleotide--dimethylbenzimidazole phosphoribosyltransferase
MTTLQKTIAKIRPLCSESMEDARRRQDVLTKPKGSLGRLEELSVQLAGIRRTQRPVVRDKVILTMAGDHGVVDEGVALYPRAVTVQQVLNFLRGGGGVNVLGRHAGARVVLVDMGVDYDFEPAEGLQIRKVAKGTASMLKGPAMTREQALRAVEEGIEAVEQEAEKGMDILGTGEMGIGNTTPSTAIACAVTGVPVPLATGRGAGLTDEGLLRKIAVIEASLALHRPDPKDGLDVLSKVGGFEIGGIAGAILGAASMGIPVVVDGFISTAGAVIAFLLCPGARDYMIFSHHSVEIGHEHMLGFLGAKPLLDLGLRLGEGTGAALAISIAEGAARILDEMATFESAGVSGPLEAEGVTDEG